MLKTNLKDPGTHGETVAVGATRGCPYARKDELVQKKILPRGTYEQIKCKIVAKQK
jgi:competence protein ComEA